MFWKSIKPIKQKSIMSVPKGENKDLKSVKIVHGNIFSVWNTLVAWCKMFEING